jgi:hypothetical protein
VELNYEVRRMNYGLNSFIVKITKYQLGYGYGDDLPALLRKALQAGTRYVLAVTVAVTTRLDETV